MTLDPTTLIRLTKVCEDVFEEYAERLFQENRLYNTHTRSQIPLIGGGEYNVEGPYFKERRRVVDALRSQHLFHLLGPGWAPRLPLHQKECEAMAHDPDPRHRVVALFAKSLHASGWHVSEAYGFPDFVRGLLADPQAPAEIRNDARLRKEFPPVEARPA